MELAISFAVALSATTTADQAGSRVDCHHVVVLVHVAFHGSCSCCNTSRGRGPFHATCIIGGGRRSGGVEIHCTTVVARSCSGTSADTSLIYRQRGIIVTSIPQSCSCCIIIATGVIISASSRGGRRICSASRVESTQTATAAVVIACCHSRTSRYPSGSFVIIGVVHCGCVLCHRNEEFIPLRFTWGFLLKSNIEFTLLHKIL